MDFSVARTRDEAHLFLDLHPCERCGSVDVTWQHALVDVAGQLLSRYSGTCPGCAREREFLFALPPREIVPGGHPTFGGSEPSELLDAGEWLWVADLTAGETPADERSDGLAIAIAAIDEVVKFIRPGDDDVPDSAFWSDRGRRVREAQPERFHRNSLLAARESYRRALASQ